MSDIDILVSEVGPRDGLQSIKAIMPTEAKKAWIDAEAATFVMSKNIHTPMSFGIVAFRDREDAALFAEEMQGQLHDFNSFLKACQGNSQGHDHG